MGNTDSTPVDIIKEKSEVYEDWTMAPGDLGGVPVTVFSAAHPASSRKRPYLERALQASRVYRHPGLLKYLDGGVVGGEVVVVMERATPLLHHHLHTLSPLHISAGLLSIIETLIFLHDRAGVSHNNVSAASIFITPDGSWKLWGLEYSCSFGELTRDYVEHINSHCHEPSIPPDDKTRISPAYQHARDSYAFARLVEHVLTPDTLAELAGADEFLEEVTSKGLSKDWTERPRLTSLAQHKFFTHDFLNVYHTLTNILLLTEDKREEFLKSVGERLRQYPEEVVSGTLAGALLSRPLLLHPAAASHLIPTLLIPHNNSGDGDVGGLFGKDVFQRDLVPQVVRLFGEHDATVRTLLLTHLPHYVSLIPRQVLADQVLPEVLLGIHDSSDGLVKETLHALAHLVPLLGADTAAASLPPGKGPPSQFINTKETKTTIATTNKPKKNPVVSVPQLESPLKFSEPPPPPPPPRSISLPVVDCEGGRSDATSLDSLSLDGLVVAAQIPERSSPDGGEASMEGSGSGIGGILTLPPQPSGSDGEAWSSDWEEMLDTPHQDFSSVLLSLNHHTPPPLNNFEGIDWNVDKVFTEDNNGDSNSSSSSSTNSDKIYRHDNTIGHDKHTNSEKKRTSLGSSSGFGKDFSWESPSVAVKQSSGMKLKGMMKKKEDLESPQKMKKMSQSLGEEYDVLAIKVNKKRDPELDLFADLVPHFNTKKFDLETLLVEADHKVNSRNNPDFDDLLDGSSRPRVVSVSETLAALDTAGADEAWGEEAGWGEPLDLPASPFPSLPVSPCKQLKDPSALTRSTDISSSPGTTSSVNDRLPTHLLTKDFTSTGNSESKDGWDDGWGDEF
ncbi:hypothetical protein Pmani_007630 [Petrolisthes manimaculis]|uniref:Protein kinase domain-containing protein n=1 Tax=Petrolisthes manimaculis TaxID=1843537 RepID=A0AAE1UFF6_9EUCA|nr:hypothetical protein Pmani_007630 [Petrolisthes manimaculis]